MLYIKNNIKPLVTVEITVNQQKVSIYFLNIIVIVQKKNQRLLNQKRID